MNCILRSWWCSSVSVVSEGLLFGLAGVVVHAASALLAPVLLNPRHDIVDSEKHARGLNGGLEGLQLHRDGVPDIGGTHVHDLTDVSVNALVETAV